LSTLTSTSSADAGRRSTIKSRAALVREIPGKYEIHEVDIERPRQGEVLIKIAASGMCHSDLSLATGTMPSAHLPMIGGHEGAGVIVEVGRDTPGFREGQPVVLSCLPQCGRCRWCATGHGNMCDLGINMPYGSRFDDHTSFKAFLDGEPVGQWTAIGTFSEYTTASVNQVIPVAADTPLETVCVIGCGVNTGWGSSANMADIKPGHTVIVMGVGGVGNYAVQGALHAGATNVIAVDPLPLKREVAQLVGATHTCEHIDEATELALSLTHGVGADSCVITVDVLQPQFLTQAFASVRKLGTIVVTALNVADVFGAEISLWELTLYQKRLQGALFGGASPMSDIPKMLDMYRAGQLKLDETVTGRYRLKDINTAWDDLRAGKSIRNVIVFD
jgi:S-(hydroxymethyl)glutathione dehydrogenase/alcohol dehydrogenase